MIRWLSDTDGHPVERLKAIFKTHDSQQARAFAPLDCLYTLILEAACSKEAGDLVLPCLFIVAYDFMNTLPFFLQSPLRRVSLLSHIFQKDCGYIRLMLQPLHSVLQVPDEDDSEVYVYHKSYSEYLRDSSRSGIYWVEDQKVVTLLLTKALEMEYKGLGSILSLKFLWVHLPRENVEMTPDLIDALARTQAVDYALGMWGIEQGRTDSETA
ncbi:hypothetical protein AX16_005978 [Volvariella volvacea WC 439]|nr:hypothetical protein AX16_005978 [Volvariella volvacea WC 439]